MPTTKKSLRWSNIKAGLDSCDRKGLIGLLRDLYEASETNRRFLHARYGPSAEALENYRRLVSEAVAPDPFSGQRDSLRDATAAITEYRRATGDIAGCVDLMLEFVEAGTEQTAEFGGGDDAYFSALERKIREVMRALGDLADKQRVEAIDRLIHLGEYGDRIGWGYGDFLLEIAATLQKRQDVQGERDSATRSNNALEPSASARSRTPRLIADVRPSELPQRASNHKCSITRRYVATCCTCSRNLWIWRNAGGRDLTV